MLLYSSKAACIASGSILKSEYMKSLKIGLIVCEIFSLVLVLINQQQSEVSIYVIRFINHPLVYIIKISFATKMSYKPGARFTKRYFKFYLKIIVTFL